MRSTGWTNYDPRAAPLAIRLRYWLSPRVAASRVRQRIARKRAPDPALLDEAEQYAQSLGHSYVGTEHLLVVSLRRMDVAVPIRAADADTALRQLVGTGDHEVEPPLVLTPHLMEALREMATGTAPSEAATMNPASTAASIVLMARR